MQPFSPRPQTVAFAQLRPTTTSLSPRPPTFARPSTPITACLRAPSPTPHHSPCAIPQFTRSLRAKNANFVQRTDGVHSARLQTRVVLSKDDPLLISKTEPAFPHDIDLGRTRGGTTFGVPSRRVTAFAGRPYDAPLAEIGPPSSLSASFASMTASGMSATNSSGKSFGSTASKSSGRVAPMTVTMPDSRPRVSNYSNEIGRSRWTGTGSPGNRSYYRARPAPALSTLCTPAHACMNPAGRSYACTRGGGHKLSLTGALDSRQRQPSPPGATPSPPALRARASRPRGESIVRLRPDMRRRVRELADRRNGGRWIDTHFPLRLSYSCDSDDM